jgi:tellurite resistance protein TerC
MTWLWLGFLALVFALLAIDLGVFHRRSHDVTLKEAGIWSAVWIALGTSFSGVVYAIYEFHWFGALAADRGGVLQDGAQAAVQYLTGYLLEKSLSIDNIFVMAVVFDRFSVPTQYRHRILYWGIIGALVSRAAMILSGVWLVSHFEWLFYVFGAYLLYTGAKLFRSEEEQIDPESTLFVRAVRRVIPLAAGDHGPRFVTRVDGRLAFTQLALVLVVIEGTDVIFALDSIPAILAITTDSFVVFTSNIFAILGLRSLYFVLNKAIDRFAHLKTALAFILIFIGAKMVLHSVYKVRNTVSLAVIGVAVAIGLLTSLLIPRSPEGARRASPPND